MPTGGRTLTACDCESYEAYRFASTLTVSTLRTVTVIGKFLELLAIGIVVTFIISPNRSAVRAKTCALAEASHTGWEDAHRLHA